MIGAPVECFVYEEESDGSVADQETARTQYHAELAHCADRTRMDHTAPDHRVDHIDHHHILGNMDRIGHYMHLDEADH